MKTWLLLDTNYLCWRAFYAMRELSHEGVATGVLFGVFRDIREFQEIHNTHRICFCFDYGRGKRKDLFDGYKSSRAEGTEEEQMARREVRKQADLLRTLYLRELGYRNVFYQKGYEADDIIASLCSSIPRTQRVIIISADHDLYQLLWDNVSLWNPKAKVPYTVEMFRQEWRLSPTQWADVKAIAGCKTDDIPGMDGIGEKTAAKFLNGTLKQSSKAYQKIVKGPCPWNKNLPLVTLPFPGVQTFRLKKDKVTEEKWKRVAKSLGMRSLIEDRSRAMKTHKREKRKGFDL